MPLHPSQLLLADKLTRYALWSSNAIFCGAIGLCISTLLPSHIASKISNTAIATGLFFVATKLDELADFGSEYQAQVQVASLKVHSQYIETAIAKSEFPHVENAIAISQPVVKYAPIESSLKKPHLMILGETGSGKSTICKYLVSQVNAPCLIIDPHASPTDWRGFTVIGSGRNYDAIATEFERLANLMQLRYEARDKGVSQFEPLIVIIDEFPAIASSLGKGATDTVKLLAREARKVSIRMCLLSQGAEVRTLGLEGEGSIRECFAMLRLGNFALSHAKAHKLSEVMENSDRPAMLDQLPCNLPILSDGQTMPVLPMPRDYQSLLTAPHADTIQPSFDPVDSPSAIVNTSAPPKLSAPLVAILDYARKQNEYVTARKIQSGIRLFRDTSANEIRGYFQWLADRGYGVVRGADEALEFSVN